MSAETPAAPAKKSSLGSFLGKTVLALIVLLLVFAGYIAGQPNDFQVERSATMSAPPDAVFEQVNDLHKWEHWSPWARLDPNAKNTFEGPESGKGAVFRWAGNDKVGEGAMTILESQPAERIKMQLDFKKPMEDTSITDFLFQPAGDGTKVTWTMSGRYQNFLQKAVCKVMNMDKHIGSYFEEGLASMKKIVEAKS